MSLSQDILEKNLDKVRRRIRLGANINDFDAYGYTPLILAVMTGQLDIIDLLLSHGADSNRPDLFGQPPLHWAVKSESVPICLRLLKQGAFPNTISAYGEPLLVYPLLKKNSALIEVLTKHGTDRTCAEDYILVKSLGHHFELQGFGLYKNYNLLVSLVDYQGFRLEFSISHLAQQMETYVHAGKAQSLYAKDILTVLEKSQKMRFLKKALPSEQESGFTEYLGPVNFIPMAFDGHAVSLAYSENFVVCCDRAQGQEATTTFYQMPTVLTSDQVSFLLYGKKNRDFWIQLPTLMHWKKLCTVSIPFQIVGNCSWANLEPAPILLEALYRLEKGEPPQPEQWAQQYAAWSNWNKNNLIQKALVRSVELKGDRRTALLLTLFHLFISAQETLERFEPLMDILNKEQALFEAIGYQHYIAKTSWSPKIQKWIKKNGWSSL